MATDSQDFRRYDCCLANLGKSDRVRVTKFKTQLSFKKVNLQATSTARSVFSKLRAFAYDDADKMAIIYLERICELVLVAASKTFDDFLSPIHLQLLC